MAPVPNPRVLFASIPSGYPVPGENTKYDDSEKIDLENIELKGGYITRTVLLSPEPWLRERMRDPSIVSYGTPMRMGLPIIGPGLMKVLRSEDPKIKEGEFLYGTIPWQLYIVHPWDGWKPYPPGSLPDYTVDMDHGIFNKVEKLPGGKDWTSLPGVVGIAGMTAWMALKEHGDLKKGETIYISTGAGAVGLMVCQFAKFAGLKVIASTGSDEKVKYLLEEIGVDHAFNYKTTNVDAALSKWGPIDVYWDNVGGPTLDAAILHCKVNARIIACGYITEYNGQEKYGVKNLAWLFKKRIKIYGILLPDLIPKWLGPFFEEVYKLLSEGKLKTREHIVHGLENADTAWVDMLQGKHLGKTVVVISDADA
ncbi:hypothetical protein M422DRAFT_33392 [Sphaerobolus stellatus SS14]|uniref:Enoyl reductase (ER) domain-containing protein n=1 Tax=Sphaerobolus stellatus (strain SS14) TaxID=990650 RepID=A0A0C9UTT1_SPHS4|nr:hypothetical protein M422DRAFT_33392 [Sphaerobolus stellatus SS14]